MFRRTSKTRSRFYQFLLTITILFGALLINNPLISLAAGSEPSLMISSCKIPQGETGVVVITGQNIPSPGIAGYQISIQYDPLMLEVIGFEKTASDKFSMQIPNYDTLGTVRLAAIQTSGEEGDFTIARVRFKAKYSAVGSTNLGLTIKELVLSDLKILQAQATNGLVDITKKSGQDITQLGPLTLSIMSLPEAVVNQPYSVTLNAKNGTPPYVWSASGLPDGLKMNPQTGEISGILTSTAGSSFVQVSISDNSSSVQMVSAQLPLEVLH